MDSTSPSRTDVSDIEQYRALLQVSEAIVSHRDLPALFRDLAQRLPGVASFDFIGLILHDAARQVMRVHILETANADRLPPELSGFSLPIEDSAGGWVWRHQQPLIVPCIEAEPRFPRALGPLKAIGVASFCMIPLTTAMRRLGAIGFGSVQPCAFGDAEVEFLSQVASQVAVAVDNVLNHAEAESAREQLVRERDRLRLLLEINNAVASHLALRELFDSITASIRRVLKADVVSLTLLEPETNELKLYALDFPGRKGFIEEGTTCTLCGCPASTAITQREAVVLGRRDLEESESTVAKRLLAEGVRSACCVPLLLRDRTLGALNLGSLQEEAFSRADAEILREVASQIALAVANSLAYREIADLKEKLAKEKLYLEDEIRTAYNFEEIIGESPALKRVLKEVEIVAPTDSTVLILGETGTGKELIARAIHNLSGRRDGTFVKMNCAAIPTGLLESELFGHEKGAFTGAISQKLGRFELADGGTLFLDEIGDIPVELQSKLLRVLQEQEFERLGGTRTIKVNVRLVAATNRDLGKMVDEKAFRSDLFYRLNVFPLRMPALRERPEDVPLLVRYFAQKFARQMNRRIERVSTETMTALTRYQWPGNVRELENVVERAVILSQGTELHVSLPELKAGGNSHPNGLATLEDAERAHILRALQEAGWIIGGPSGAAAKLGMKRTTLQSKMQKLGIFRPR